MAPRTKVLRTFLALFSYGYLCYSGGSTTFGQIVRRPLATYNLETLVRVRGKHEWVAAYVYLAIPTFQLYEFFDA